ncbi:MAG: DNA translocase FtsK [Clostridia bacterium]|nr:DNA translocase FtsK [Clostridia bacterium]
MAEKKKYKITKSSNKDSGRKQTSGQKKKTAPSGSGKNPDRNTSSRGKNGVKDKKEKKNVKNKPNENEYRELNMWYRAAPFIIGLVTLFLLICMIFPNGCGFIGKALRGFFFGMLGYGTVFLFPILIIIALCWNRDAVVYALHRRIAFGAGEIVSVAVLLAEFSNYSRTFSVADLYTNGKLGKGGGVIGGLISAVLGKLFGRPGVLIITIAALIFCTAFLIGLTPDRIAEYYRRRKSEAEERELEKLKRKRRKPKPHTPPDDPEEEVYDDPGYDEEDDDRYDHNDIFDIDRPDIDPDPYGGGDGEEGETLKPENGGSGGENQGSDDSGFEDIFGVFEDGGKESVQEEPVVDIPEETIPVERGDLIPDEEKKEPEEEKKPERPPYVFPPMSFLPVPKKQRNVDNSRELRANGEKLVATLASFKVHTRIVNISQGPTITRYELVPEQGVRVRAIANLVDDISLSLATQGVRIEAPIPGKAAVGIEVPNGTASTVFLRELLENPEFQNAKSLITVAIGMDVAGAPIYADISKMPHLLIAGATGMGKSVCINSMIISLLYRADPEQVKLMLIDPKKVELSIYNGLPHLLVPVVSDPKKAAGSLRWAVCEMERRFELIESVGVRDIYNYNVVTKNDPDFEFLPHIIIIIDELADLMMTAPDDVEESVCRLAQKARAAGMHLIIGTQRPSVDVITGLIKANIPSRIAFTVASQVDSRTIIDVSGAEKLMGRGDMLYAPVGIMKPMRVQGAFVSEQEVERITDFIKSNQGDIEYDDRVIETIEEEAKKCGAGKKGASHSFLGADDDGGKEDPMLRPAIELAIESEKISTSLIQRRLNLGYGRSAKLIDIMEQRGIVSAPEGQKPRRVLITKAQYQEMLAAKSPDDPDSDES